MAHQTIETIWHFVGYIHLEELLNLNPAHYTGAPQYQSSPYNPDATGIPDASTPPPIGNQGYNAPDVPITPTTHVGPTARFNLNFPERDAGSIPVDLGTPVNFAPLLRLPATPDFAFEFEPPEFTIELTYTIGESQYAVIQSYQLNTLNDDDIVLGDTDLISPEDIAAAQAHVAQAQGIIDDLIETAEAALPEQFAELFEELPGGLDAAHIHSAEENTPQLKNAGNPEDASEVEANGTFVNGQKVSDTGESRDDQLEDISDYSNLVNNTDEDEEDPETSIEISNDWGATGGPAQITTLGDNASVNIAVMQDFGDAFGSTIILGDLYSTDAIAQINVLENIDTAAVIAGIPYAPEDENADQLQNEASFTNIPGTVYGDSSIPGFGGSFNWNVDYVYGDYVDVTTITQLNILSDNDINIGTPTQAHQTVVLGENGQLDAAQMAELGKQYDLIVVSGDYHKFNGIVQMNVLGDNDNVTLIGSHTADGTQQLGVGGNQLINDASIYSIGGMSYKPLSDEAADLASAISDMETEFSYEMAFGLPGSVDDDFDVLFITGDYYTYNWIHQTNVVSDMDYSQDSMAGTDDPYEQITQAGGNSLINAALIIDQDSTSDYQFLGGDAFDDTLLVQANFVDGEETNTDDVNDIHEDVVAALAAMTEAAQTTSSSNNNDNSATSETTTSEDVLGGMIA